MHYYKGQSPVVPLMSIASICDELPGPEKINYTTREPVIIVFIENGCYLTPDAKYPLSTVKNKYRDISTDPLLSVYEFRNLKVFRLKKNTNNFFKDIYTIITRILPMFPENYLQAELHLTAAVIADDLGLPNWRYHADQANSLASGPEISQILFHLKNKPRYPPKGRRFILLDDGPADKVN